MNGSCAGGTGAFIDQNGRQNVSVEKLGELALKHEKIFPLLLVVVCLLKLMFKI